MGAYSLKGTQEGPDGEVIDTDRSLRVYSKEQGYGLWFAYVRAVYMSRMN